MQPSEVDLDEQKPVGGSGTLHVTVLSIRSFNFLFNNVQVHGFKVNFGISNIDLQILKSYIVMLQMHLNEWMVSGFLSSGSLHRQDKRFDTFRANTGNDSGVNRASLLSGPWINVISDKKLVS